MFDLFGMFQIIASCGILLNEGCNDNDTREAVETMNNNLRTKKIESLQKRAYAGEFNLACNRKDENRWLQRTMFRAAVQEGVLFKKYYGHDTAFSLVPDYCLWFVRDENGDVVRDGDGNPVLTSEMARFKYIKGVLEEGLVNPDKELFTTFDNKISKYIWFEDADPYIPSDEVLKRVPDNFRLYDNILDYYGGRANVMSLPKYRRDIGSSGDNRKYDSENPMRTSIVDRCHMVKWLSDPEYIEKFNSIQAAQSPSKEYYYTSDGEKIPKNHYCNSIEHQAQVDINLNSEYGDSFRLYPAIPGTMFKYKREQIRFQHQTMGNRYGGSKGIDQPNDGLEFRLIDDGYFQWSGKNGLRVL